MGTEMVGLGEALRFSEPTVLICSREHGLVRRDSLQSKLVKTVHRDI